MMMRKKPLRRFEQHALLLCTLLLCLLAGCAQPGAPGREPRPRRGAPQVEVTRVVTRYYGAQEPREILYFRGPEIVAMENMDREGGVTVSGYIPDGVVREYYPDDTVFTEIPFRNNQREGTARYYYEDGRLRAEVNWRGNRLHGKVTEYNFDGSVISVKTYRDGRLVEEEPAPTP